MFSQFLTTDQNRGHAHIMLTEVRMPNAILSSQVTSLISSTSPMELLLRDYIVY